MTILSLFSIINARFFLIVLGRFFFHPQECFKRFLFHHLPISIFRPNIFASSVFCLNIIVSTSVFLTIVVAVLPSLPFLSSLFCRLCRFHHRCHPSNVCSSFPQTLITCNSCLFFFLFKLLMDLFLSFFLQMVIGLSWMNWSFLGVVDK